MWLLQRRYNTLSLLDYYMGPGRLHKDDISWNSSDPNVLKMTLPGMEPRLLLALKLDKPRVLRLSCESMAGRPR